MSVYELNAEVTEFDGLTVVEFVLDWFDSDDCGTNLIDEA